jgi:hypothetical protein
MRISGRHWLIAASLGIGTALTACSHDSSTAPAAVSTTQFADTADSIFSADLTSQPAAATAIARYIETSPAYGGSEASPTINTSAGSLAVLGVAYAFITGADTTFYVSIYTANTLEQVAVVWFTGGSGTAAGGEGTGSQFVTTGAGVVTNATGQLLTTGSSCSLETSLAADSAITAWVGGGATCEMATIEVSFVSTFPVNQGLGALTADIVSNISFTGPVFEASGASQAVGIRSREGR